jgi:hypothetical protein
MDTYGMSYCLYFVVLLSCLEKLNYHNDNFIGNMLVGVPANDFLCGPLPVQQSHPYLRCQ